MAGLITTTLDACWAAVEAWPALKDSFQTKFKTDEQLAYLDKSGIGVAHIGIKAAITIRLQPFNVVPRLQKGIDFPMAFKAEIWLKQERTRPAQDMIEEIIKSWYASRPAAGQPTFLETATCGPPQQILGIEVKSIAKGENDQKFQVCYASATAVFKALVNPNS